jgi:hypothetical protein
MATVNNATGVYATLGYNFDDPNGNVPTLSTSALKHLNTMPVFITTWQAEDIRNNNVGGYYQNPLATDLINLANTSLTISDLSDANGLSNLRSISVNLANTANVFIEHTNRLTGITPFVGSDQVNPYLDQAISYGKTALYITNQTDSIKNTSPIMGSFTSLLIGEQITANLNTIIAFAEEIDDSIINRFDANTIASTLSSERVQTMNLYMRAANTFLNTRMNSDINYYGNLKNFIDKYNQTKKFTKLGETEEYLYMNFVASDKLKSRIS